MLNNKLGKSIYIHKNTQNIKIRNLTSLETSKQCLFVNY